MQNNIDLIGNYDEFVNAILNKTKELGIDIKDYQIDHIGIRSKNKNEYIEIKAKLIKYSKSYLENVHHGRFNSKFKLIKPLETNNHKIRLIELAESKEETKTGLEHIELVVGNDFEELKKLNLWSGIEINGQFNDCLYITFNDKSCIKFHKYSLEEVIRLEGNKFESVN